ncbi:MAG TPA: phosphoribosylformylglycinamidine synthase subunit PurS [bacterium]|nr:phosphoribosylformylglycinamidine synthase subunit PurS [bacterium]
MTTIRITITLKPGVLDAQGQAVLQGLRTLGHDQVSGVRVGRYIELIVPDGIRPADLDQMCERFLANPLLEEWRIDDPRRTPLSVGERTG